MGRMRKNNIVKPYKPFFLCGLEKPFAFPRRCEPFRKDELLKLTMNSMMAAICNTIDRCSFSILEAIFPHTSAASCFRSLRNLTRIGTNPKFRTIEVAGFAP
jgi:hypothetical protein